MPPLDLRSFRNPREEQELGNRNCITFIFWGKLVCTKHFQNEYKLNTGISLKVTELS